MKILIVAALALSAAPAFAQTAEAPSAATAQAAEKPKEERRICRRLEGAASRMNTQRVCMTREEWRRYQRNQ